MESLHNDIAVILDDVYFKLIESGIINLETYEQIMHDVAIILRSIKKEIRGVIC